ncbi:unnamed protein product [Soboliphyme baturini]|uniref:Secreted protein n=1 Tax=Soboliphyme baturini TaxID=241478 RepID=A0A183IWV4_9BILA|nr:unnamed protein product [Soboliphyme baturini]
MFTSCSMAKKPRNLFGISKICRACVWSFGVPRGRFERFIAHGHCKREHKTRAVCWTFPHMIRRLLAVHTTRRQTESLVFNRVEVG